MRRPSAKAHAYSRCGLDTTFIMTSEAAWRLTGARCLGTGRVRSIWSMASSIQHTLSLAWGFTNDSLIADSPAASSQVQSCQNACVDLKHCTLLAVCPSIWFPVSRLASRLQFCLSQLMRISMAISQASLLHCNCLCNPLTVVVNEWLTAVL